MVTQPAALGYHPGQAQRPRHSQLPPINTSFSAHSAQSAPALQVHGIPAAPAGYYAYGPFVPPQMGGSRSANAPVMASLTPDPPTLQRMYTENASTSRPNTAPTRVTQGSSKPVVDLTGEPDSDDDRRQTKKARLASLPAASRPATATPAGPSTQQTQSSTAYAGPVNGQAQLATHAQAYASSAPLLWLTPNRDLSALPTDEDIQMRSPAQEAPRQVPMEVVQQAQALLESPPVYPQTTDTALSASNSGTGMPMNEQQPAQSSLNPSAEVIQQCIDENFINAENADAGGGDQEGSGKRVCRMCQIRYTRGLSEKVPEVFPAEASMDDLARHCQEEHPKGWLILLQRCMEDEESDEDE
ncbi:hypothetical protein DAEQUDRAFT_108095 [Daedalea quercina L-15889]|uniref:Uncharacterized protein n=1 Tax=Daedalea quercina L-15889 TaxID=1314783 RepID=A0A165S318_9APHY|nr:hypothetical protein DAEQUDRAFT_108095 [Daedalea quercina L-15889]